MIQRLIIFLIRMRLGLKKGQHFRFVNQGSKFDTYFFTGTELKKVYYYGKSNKAFAIQRSNVSLNWILDDECKIVKLPMDYNFEPCQ